MPTYKTPDVYVEELSVFPPSVAEVETAIPAFIGYTARATKLVASDLRNTPTRVKSLLEYETYFGGAPEIVLAEVALDNSNEFVSAAFTNDYYLYDSIRSFFDNGGGPCYIVSVGSYSDTIDRDALKSGLDAIRKYDEPTLLLFPDAAGLDAGKLGAVQQHALKQCADLGDRVAVLDMRRTDYVGGDFRDTIGINNLKYGAAYTPWLKVNYSKNVSYDDIRGVIKKGMTSVTLATLTSDPGIQGTLNKLDAALADADAVETKLATLLAGSPSINASFAALLTAYQTNKTAGNIQAIHQFLYRLADLVDDLSADVAGTEFSALIGNAIANSLVPAFTQLIANERQLAAAIGGGYTEQWGIDPDPAATEWGDLFDAGAPSASTTPDLTGAATDAAKADRFIPNIVANFAIINGQIDGLIAASGAYASTYEQALHDTYPVYKNIVRGINDTLSAIPPSGAIAGIYAMVDNQRGVWKAPANVSLSNVIGPVYNFDTDETDNLNVDANAGKSINAIRAFAGKGTLVWGARTLAGNDNEWRYVSVRRFFNMVEESVKKSTYWSVFEPNDANTWVKVRGMIENYLTQKWREGALAGATTKDAFFVRCGLGTTMTSQDILEGRMNVEIGMAVVRPAEFVILKFSHKLQTS